MRIVVAPDKFRGTLTARQAAQAVAAGVPGPGAQLMLCPLADGGEGLVDAFGGANRRTDVTGPDLQRVHAGWRLDGGSAVIEMAAASGLALAGGADRNDPVAATTRGTGQLLAAAIEAGATDILVGAGGSATTDGGLGAVQALLLGSHDPLRGVRVQVAADVRTGFLDAATVFGPQKGASPEVVEQLTERLRRIRGYYLDRFGVDVATLERSGAAGGLAGGLAALGAELVDGFAAVADRAGLGAALAGADLVVTGEGALDTGSFDGKVVGGVAGRAAALGVPVLIVAGRVDRALLIGSPDDGRLDPALLPDGAEVTVVDLSATFGAERAQDAAAGCVTEAVARHLALSPA